MTRDIGVYDAKEVTVVIDEIIATGFGEGDFVKCEKVNEVTSTHVSAKGDVGVAINHDSLGKITVTLSQISSVYELLMERARARKQFPIWVISNNQVKEKMGGTMAHIKKYPEATFGNEISNRVFEIEVYDYEQ